jgi:hypothetical protein
MKHINTLKVYKDALLAGFDERQAIHQAETFEKSFADIFQDLKEDFASQRLIYILGGIMLTVLVAIGGELWWLSKEVSILSRDMQEVRQHIFAKG